MENDTCFQVTSGLYFLQLHFLLHFFDRILLFLFRLQFLKYFTLLAFKKGLPCIDVIIYLCQYCDVASKITKFKEWKCLIPLKKGKIYGVVRLFKKITINSLEHEDDSCSLLGTVSYENKDQNLRLGCLYSLEKFLGKSILAGS